MRKPHTHSYMQFMSCCLSFVLALSCTAVGYCCRILLFILLLYVFNRSTCYEVYCCRILLFILLLYVFNRSPVTSNLYFV